MEQEEARQAGERTSGQAGPMKHAKQPEKDGNVVTGDRQYWYYRNTNQDTTTYYS